MTRRILLITLKLFAVSAPLAWLWLAHLRYFYMDFFAAVATPLFDSLGMGNIPTGYRTRFINVVPFVALVLLTPKLGARRKSLGILLGLVVIVAGHLAFSGIAGYALLNTSSGGAAQNSFAIHIAGMLLSDSMPLLLWLVIAGPYIARSRNNLLAGSALFSPPPEEPAEPRREKPSEELS